LKGSREEGFDGGFASAGMMPDTKVELHDSRYCKLNSLAATIVSALCGSWFDERRNKRAWLHTLNLTLSCSGRSWDRRPERGFCLKLDAYIVKRGLPDGRARNDSGSVPSHRGRRSIMHTCTCFGSSDLE
jgi:hypothetical protein